MRTKLHVPCNFASAQLHAARMARRQLAAYACHMPFDEQEYARKIGERLRRARKAMHPKMTQGAAAERLAELLGDSESAGASASRVSNYENAIRLPDLRIISLLCEIYGCSVASILDDEHAARTEQEYKLLQMYRSTDDRGRSQITRVAESQPADYAAEPGAKTG